MNVVVQALSSTHNCCTCNHKLGTSTYKESEDKVNYRDSEFDLLYQTLGANTNARWIIWTNGYKMQIQNCQVQNFVQGEILTMQKQRENNNYFAMI